MAKEIQVYNDINHALCFNAFQEGSSLEAIADEFNHSITALQRVARTQGWSAIAAQSKAELKLDGARTSSLEKLQKNRDANFDQAVRLRGEVDRTIEEVTADGSFALAPQVLKEIAAATSVVHDLTYRALGEKDKQTKPGQGGTDKVPSIIVNLPGAIAQPRNVSPDA